MTAPFAPAPARPGRFRVLRRRLSRLAGRVDFWPRLEIAFAVLALLLGLASYAILTGERAPAEGFSPPLVTLLLVANLLPLMALMFLIARRFTILIGNRREGRAGARLHVRLVALFSTVAAVPTLLVVVFASLLFQFGVQFWFSDRARTVLENADQVAQAYVLENKQRIVADISAMAGDVNAYVQDFGLSNALLSEGLELQVAARNLNEAAIFAPRAGGVVSYASVGIGGGALTSRIRSIDLSRARTGEPVVIASASDRVEAVVRIDPVQERYVYVSRKVDPQVLAQVARTQNALSEYTSLIERSRGLQGRFNLMLAVVSLLILSVAIWFALWLANRLVTPIGRLANAAEKVGAGDFTARVPVRGSPDEIGILARSFNRMTTQIQAQKTALVTANEQLDRRREFIEAVLSGVSAGVLSVDGEGCIRLANRSAAALLQGDEASLVGRRLREVAPELESLVDEAHGQGRVRGQVHIERGTAKQTLAAQVTAGPGGAIVTFDDISQQLDDQRQAAWADVARRIAHEIKNPLTPIQLSAERLQRKYGKQISDGQDVFVGLTDTIIRQVGDLRRMVDEFSSFARMPKPLFRPESMLDIARQALLLQEVAHPGIKFTLDAPDALPLVVCDRRQIAQALTNLVKNATEAVAAREGGEGGRIRLAIRTDGDMLTLDVEDNGIGLPGELRNRLTEPYVTTRARGTGLGLAIVKKIVEEHGGDLSLDDADDGGTRARMRFDMRALADRTGEGDEVAAPATLQKRG